MWRVFDYIFVDLISDVSFATTTDILRVIFFFNRVEFVSEKSKRRFLWTYWSAWSERMCNSKISNSVVAGYSFVSHLYTVRFSGADSIRHGGTCPHFYKWLGTVEGAPWVEQQQTRKRSPKRLIALLEPKKFRGSTKKFFYAPPVHFQIRSGATGYINSMYVICLETKAGKRRIASRKILQPVDRRHAQYFTPHSLFRLGAAGEDIPGIFCLMNFPSV